MPNPRSFFALTLTSRNSHCGPRPCRIHHVNAPTTSLQTKLLEVIWSSLTGNQYWLAEDIAVCTHPAYQRRSLRRPFRGIKFPGRSNLGGGFPLRCFQRLSRPYIATRQCHCSDNRNTRGTSIPVLSY